MSRRFRALALTLVAALGLTLFVATPANADPEVVVQHDDENLSIAVTRDAGELEFSIENVGTQTELVGLGAYLSTSGTQDLLWQSGPYAEQFRVDLAPGETFSTSAPFWPGAYVTIFRDRETTLEEVVSFQLAGDWVGVRMSGAAEEPDLEVGPEVHVQGSVLTPGESVLVSVEEMPTIGRVEAWISSDSSLDLVGDNWVQTPGASARMIGVGYAGYIPSMSFVAEVPADLAPGDYQIFFEGPDARIVHYDIDPIVVVAGTAEGGTPGSVAITGRARLDFTVSAETVGWDPAATLVYQWFANGTPVLRSNESTLVVDYDEIGKQLTVEVSAWQAGHARVSVLSPPTAAVTSSFFTGTPAPTFTGNLVVGQKLTAVAPVWSPTTGFDYQWFADGVQVGTGTRVYTLTAADLGKSMMVWVTSTRAGFHTTGASSEWSAPVAPGTLTPPVNVELPKIIGTPRVGNTVELRLGTWRPSPSFEIQWTIDGAAIPDATGTTLVVPATVGGSPTIGGQLAASVVVSSSGYLDATANPVAVGVVTEGVFSPRGTPSITGTLLVGETLTADPGVWDTAANLSYQWEIVNVGVLSSTGPTLVIPPEAHNKKVRLTVTATADGFTAVVRNVTTATKVP